MAAAARTALLLATVLAVCFALAQVGGRLFFAHLDQFEDRVNAHLEKTGIAVGGLTGSWRYLNPSVSATNVTFGGGEIEGLTLEVDVAESLWRNRFIARQLRVESARLRFVPTRAGWRLDGQHGDAELDDFFWHSDEVKLAGRIELAGHSATGIVDAQIEATNRGQRHRWRVMIVPGSARVSLAEKSSARVSLAEKSSARVSLAEKSSARVSLAEKSSARVSLAEKSSARVSLAEESSARAPLAEEISAGASLPEKSTASVSPAEEPSAGELQGESLDEDGGAGNSSKDENCGCVFVDLDVTDASGDQPAGRGRFLADNLSLSGELAAALSLPDFLLDFDGRWLGDGSLAAFAADATVVGGTVTPLQASTAVVAQAAGPDASYRGVASLKAMAGDAVVAVNGIGVSADALGVGFWAAGIDIGEVNALLATGLGRHGHWFESVAAEGKMESIVAHLGRRGFAYQARLNGVSMSNYRGVPEVANGCGLLHGHLRSFRIDFRCETVRFGLPRYFDGTWDYDVASGDVTFWYRPGYFGARGDVEVAVGSAVAGGGFALTRPRDPPEGRFVLLALADAVPVELIKRHLPQELNSDLRSWLKSSLDGGQLNAASTVYHGHTQTRPGLPNRRFEVAGLVVDGRVNYHPDWPPAESLQGDVAITGDEARVRVVEGVVFGGEVQDSDIRAPLHGGYVEILIDAHAPVERALDFVRTTPLADELDFVSASWHGDGALGIEGSLWIPIDESGQVDLDLRFDLDDVSLNLADLKLLFAGLKGGARFQSPHYLSSASVEGFLFDFPVQVSASASEQANVLDFRGQGAVADVHRVLDTHEFPIAAGVFDFNARFWAFVDPSRVPELSIDSDGVGVAINLPPPLHKPAPEPRRVDVDLIFHDDHTRAEVRGQTFTGWFDAHDGELLRGAIGVGVPLGRPDFSSSDIRLSGHFQTMLLEGDIAELTPETVPWRLDGLSVGSLWLGGLELTDVALNGVGGRDEAAIGIDSNEARGTLVMSGEEPILVSLDELRFSADETDGDLLDISVFDHVPAADVTIARTLVGDDDHGAWRFGIRPDNGAIRLTGLVGDIKGMRIEATDDLVWVAATDRSHFRGWLAADDLALVLPQWGYAASVESFHVDVETAVQWPGSPLNFELGDLTGSMRMAIDTGRFLEVDDAAGAKILSLLNFANIARRMQLDFSDVFDRGIAFDRVSGSGELDEGVLSFTDPMEIHGPGSDFRISGTVDLGDGTLDNEMIVTLPLSSNLPWYAWLATAEPVTAVGVLVGSEIFKEQIRTLSSARYRITGTIEDPNLEFVDIFRSQMDRAGEAE